MVIVCNEWMVRGNHQVIFALFFQDVIEFNQKITRIEKIILAGISVGFLMLMKPPLGIKHNKPDVFSQPRILIIIHQFNGYRRSRKSIIGQKYISAVQVFLHKLFLSMNSFQPLRSTVSPVVVSWHDDNTPIKIFNRFHQFNDPPLIQVSIRMSGIGESG